MKDPNRQAICPQCSHPLIEVRQSPHSALNQYQFDAAKAGDFYCPSCPLNNRGHSALCYWWEHELPLAHNFQI